VEIQLRFVKTDLFTGVSQGFEGGIDLVIGLDLGVEGLKVGLNLIRLELRVVDKELYLLLLDMDEHIGKEQRVALDIGSSHVDGPSDII
jgi:hypothetical protein